MRVVQSRDGAGFSFEPLLQVRVRSHMLGQHLDGNGAVQAGVGGLVDLAHAPCAEGGVDLVGAEGGAGVKGHGLLVGEEAREFLGEVLDEHDLSRRLTFVGCSVLHHQEPPVL